MDVRRLSQDVSVSSQIRAQDLTLVGSLGFRSVICNRPDGEEPGQHLFASIKTEADLRGIQMHYLPIDSGGLRAEHILELRRIWPDLPKPVLAYCRSGARSTMLFNAALSHENQG